MLKLQNQYVQGVGICNTCLWNFGDSLRTLDIFSLFAFVYWLNIYLSKAI